MSDYFDFSNPKKITETVEIYSKVNDVMCWDAFAGESDEDVFIRNGNNINDLPGQEVIDIVHVGGLQKWAESLHVPTQEALYHKLVRAIRKCISDPVFNDKKKVGTFPPFANFFYYCQKLDRNGKTDNESSGISEVAWNGVICRRNLKERTDKIFAEPDQEKYAESVAKIKDIYSFDDYTIEALRYFVCQTRHENHNPSMNKCIYHWGDDKKTGKTTIAKTIVAICNGDVLDNAGNYLSTLSRELQYNKHDIPKSAIYNAVILDEAMPKDSRKSYGAVKSMLTNDSCDFDPKFKQVITLKCKRFYYFTSNDDISEFIQDAKERRLISIHSKEKPKQLSSPDIYKLWFDFCTNAVPESNWQKWYDSFIMVDGLATKDLNEIKNEIILNSNSIFGVDKGTYITVKKVASELFKNEPTREQKKSVGQAMEDLFKAARLESNKAYYTISMCRQKISDIETNEVIPDVESNLPF